MEGNGMHGEPLDALENVIRLLKPLRDGIVTDADFTLSPADEFSPLQSLSVWAENRTPLAQALVFMGKPETYSLYAVLNVGDIRTLSIEKEPPQMVLDVVWDKLENDNRAGAEGHAGITGLLRPTGIPKLLYKELRRKIADLARNNLHSLP